MDFFLILLLLATVGFLTVSYKTSGLAFRQWLRSLLPAPKLPPGHVYREGYRDRHYGVPNHLKQTEDEEAERAQLEAWYELPAHKREESQP